nr:putative reverse transcriptase domain-containing protein [Tanacetum cinerariifolium]
MPPKRTSTSAALAMTQAAIWHLVVDSVTAALEAQTANMANVDNTNRSPKPREAPVARNCSYKEFMSCQPFNFKGSEGAVGHIRWFEHTKLVFSRSNCTEDCKVKFATGHYANQCRKSTNNNTQGRAYMLRDMNAHRDPNIVIGLDGYYRRFIKDFSKIEKSLTELTQKNKKYIWGENEKTTFQLLKQKLYKALILALPEGNDDFVVCCDASHQDYDCEIRYHPGKENVVENALSQKERIKPLQVRSLVMTIHQKLPSQILEAQTEAIKEENIKAKNLRGMDKVFEIRLDGTRCIKNQSWLPLFGPEIIHETTKKIVQIRQRLQAARDRKRSYANVIGKPLEFQVEDRVMLKVSPNKGVIRFKKQGKFNPRYIGPFKILKQIGRVSYKLELPEEISNVHSTLHISNLKKCLSDESFVIPMKEIRLDDKLNFVEELVEIMDQEVKQLKQSRIPIVKVR